MQITVNFTSEEKETMLKELRDSDVMTSEIKKFETELKTIERLEKRFKGMKLVLVNDTYHLGCTISINNGLFNKIANLVKKFISKFSIIFKMIKEIAADCCDFNKAAIEDAETISVSLNGYKVPPFFAHMSHEERKLFVMKKLINSATNEHCIVVSDLRRMAQSLMDEDVNNILSDIDKKREELNNQLPVISTDTLL